MTKRFLFGYLAILAFMGFMLLDGMGCSAILQHNPPPEDPEEEFTYACFEKPDATGECTAVVETEENSRTFTAIVTGCSEFGVPGGDIWTFSGTFSEPEEEGDTVSAAIIAIWYDSEDGYQEITLEGFYDDADGVLTLRRTDTPGPLVLTEVDC